MCMLIAWGAVLILVTLITHIVMQGHEYFGFSFLAKYPSRTPINAGIKAGLYGSLWVIVTTTLITIPIGVGSALYLEEYGVGGRIGRIIDTNIANLAGVPSIVYGLLGLSVFVRFLGFGQSILSAAATLSLLILPVVIVSSREAIKAVPNSIRLAAIALGAQKHQVIFGHVLPMAFPGIMTGIILSLSRAIGETAPLIVVGAYTYIAYTPSSVFDEFTVMPLQIYNWASRPQEEFHQVAAAGIMVLLIVMLSMNILAAILRQKAQKKVRL